MLVAKWPYASTSRSARETAIGRAASAAAALSRETSESGSKWLNVVLVTSNTSSTIRAASASRPGSAAASDRAASSKHTSCTRNGTAIRTPLSVRSVDRATSAAASGAVVSLPPRAPRAAAERPCSDNATGSASGHAKYSSAPRGGSAAARLAPRAADRVGVKAGSTGGVLP